MTTTQPINLNSGRSSVSSSIKRLGQEGVSISISAWCHPTNNDLLDTIRQVKSILNSYCFSLNTGLLNDSSVMVISSVKYDRKNTENDAEVFFELTILNKLNIEEDLILIEQIASEFYFFLKTNQDLRLNKSTTLGSIKKGERTYVT